MQEQQTDARPAAACAGRDGDDSPCPDEAEEGYEYCLWHLEATTRDHVKVKVFDIITKQLGVNSDEVSEQAAIVDDLGADSLDVADLILSFEIEFNLSFNDRSFEGEIKTVGDAIKGITDLLLSMGRYEPRRAGAAPQGVAQQTAAARRPRAAPRVGEVAGAKEVYLTADQVARSARFVKYFDKLGLDAGEMARIFRAGVGRNLIYHVTPISKRNEDGTLKLVDVLLLGRSNIYHFLLQRGPVWFEWAPLSDLIITYEIFFDDAGKISRVEVVSRSHSAQGVSDGSLRNTKLKFPGRQVRGALKFLAKFVAHTEAGR